MKTKSKTELSVTAPELPKVKKHYFDIFKLVKYVKFNWILIVLALGMAVAEQVIASKIPDASANLFDESFEMAKLWNVVGNTAITIALFAGTTIISTFAVAQATVSARRCVWGKLMNVKANYYDQHNPNSLLNTVTSDAELAAGGFIMVLVRIPAYAVYVVLCMQLLAGYHWQLLLMIGIIVFVHLAYTVGMGIWQQRVSTVHQIQLGRFTGWLAERIRNLSMIKVFGRQKKEALEGAGESAALYKIDKRTAAIAAVSSTYQSFIALLSNVMTVLWGCALIKNGDITRTEFIGASSYILLINVVMIVISLFWQLFKGYNGRAYRIARLCEAEQENPDEKVGICEIGDGDIKFSNIDFGYNSDKKVIDNVSFTIPHGKITALVGPSGSGKTTIVKLLERLYSPTGGTVTLGERNIDDFNIYAWREKLGYVVQDAGVFGGTLRDCLTYGVDREVSEDELIEITKQTGLYDYIQSNPLKFDLPVAAWGASLSGGQRQRVVISRALLRQSDILIFDEPTSALDPETANAISKLILNGFEGKTKIIISHELNYIAKADNIVFLHDGVIEAEGTHDELMKSCKTYKELVEEQSYQEVFE